MNSRPVEHTVLAGFAAILVVFGLLGALIWYGASQAARASDRVARTQEVLTSLGRIASEIARAEAASHSYLVAGTPNYLALREKGFVGAEQALEATERLVDERSGQRERLDTIRGLVDKRIEVLLHYQRVRDTDGLLAAAQTFGVGLPVTLQLHDSIDAMASF
jgi:CHASE3 domain sensor protein